MKPGKDRNESRSELMNRPTPILKSNGWEVRWFFRPQNIYSRKTRVKMIPLLVINSRMELWVVLVMSSDGFLNCRLIRLKVAGPLPKIGDLWIPLMACRQNTGLPPSTLLYVAIFVDEKIIRTPRARAKIIINIFLDHF